jgi:hypothetical protein
MDTYEVFDVFDLLYSIAVQLQLRQVVESMQVVDLHEIAKAKCEGLHFI